ncbi:beta-1,3-glucan-binding protein 1 [Plakobranchus ocellatus]|uniref:Beta-1,3-glucan-binding protein 1 n=1 Tax=Plakobranchus ocellatus TaxID=259542 RepID=A0AAV4ANT7_9GAST|nr:beta-1,3-glucan-binding protein 1 [Plakobranchus ocellatus]
MYGGRCLWQVFTASLWIFMESSAWTEATPTVNIRFAPPLLEFLLPTTDSNIGSVDFHFGFDGLLSNELFGRGYLSARDSNIGSADFRFGLDRLLSERFSAPGSLHAGHGWKYRICNQNINGAELVMAYAVIYDVNGNPAERTRYTTAYAALPRSVSCLPTRRIPGAVIFRDDFNSLEYSKWQPQVGMIGGYNSEFQAYVPDKRVLFTRDGKLYIKPMLTVDHPDFTEQSLSTGKMDLVALYGKCNMSLNKDGCVRFGQKGFLPPTMSARLHSVATLKYGILEIRAKIPLGDWLWPALWLRPRNSPYGSWPRDGQIDLMVSRAIAIRLSNNSNNAEIFRQAAEKYQEALTCSGYQQQLRYTPSHQTPPHAGAPRANTKTTAKAEQPPTQLITRKHPTAAKCTCEGTALEQGGSRRSTHRIP